MKIRDYYDRAAGERTPNYQESSAWMDALVHRPNERFVRRQVRRSLRDAESIADLGCGTGEHLCSEFPRLKRLFLNDLSSGMLDDAIRHEAEQAQVFSGLSKPISRIEITTQVELAMSSTYGWG